MPKPQNFYLFIFLTVIAAALLFAAWLMPDLKGQALTLVFMIVGAILHAIDPSAAIVTAPSPLPALPSRGGELQTGVLPVAAAPGPQLPPPSPPARGGELQTAAVAAQPGPPKAE
jgi:hypothetical protein